MVKTFIGFDTGLNGGMVEIDINGNILFKAPMPKRENVIDIHELWKMIKALSDSQWETIEFETFSGPMGLPAARHFQKDRVKETHVYIEKVSAHPGQGVTSMFKFGRVYGITEGLIVASGLPYTTITPQKWMNAMHEGMEKSLSTKTRSEIVSKRLFPDADLRATERSRVAHDGIVDALLIAEYGRRLHVRP